MLEALFLISVLFNILFLHSFVKRLRGKVRLDIHAEALCASLRATGRSEQWIENSMRVSGFKYFKPKGSINA